MEWRCFHCDEVFTDKTAAREHFGEMIDDDPLCKIKADEGGLAGEVRRLQAELADAYNQRNAYENDARLWHEAEADRRRRIGATLWWQELDAREGEKLVLQERVRELEAVTPHAIGVVTVNPCELVPVAEGLNRMRAQASRVLAGTSQKTLGYGLAAFIIDQIEMIESTISEQQQAAEEYMRKKDGE